MVDHPHPPGALSLLLNRERRRGWSATLAILPGYVRSSHPPPFRLAIGFHQGRESARWFRPACHTLLTKSSHTSYEEMLQKKRQYVNLAAVADVEAAVSGPAPALNRYLAVRN
jgi:hypothetical protein